MSSPAAMPPLPLDEWEATKDTLHLYAQVVGKVRMACTAPQNHWWNAPLYVSARGLTTRRMIWDGLSFEIDFDLIDHELVIRTDQGDVDSFALLDGLSVARFHAELMTTLERRGIRPMIRPEPFGVPMNTPFAEDSEHASYDPEYVHRLWRILLAVEAVFVEWAGWFTGKQSPVHLFWHSFDLALARFSGTRAPEREGVDRVTAESYSHEVISCGFWPGDASMRGPAFYSYTAPEPPRLTEQLLRPGDASWAESGGVALLPYEVVRTAGVPLREALLPFLQTAYEAGAITAGWDRSELASSALPAEWRQLRSASEQHRGGVTPPV